MNEEATMVKDFTAYLLRHEDDIAFEVNDYGELKEVFEACIGRLPEKTERIITRIQ
jgi:hypothetical protein